MSEYKIEKGVPLTRKTKDSTYPFKDMRVGDSFAAPLSKRNSIAMSARYYADKNPGVKFKTRKQSDTEFRIWRIV